MLRARSRYLVEPIRGVCNSVLVTATIAILHYESFRAQLSRIDIRDAHFRDLSRIDRSVSCFYTTIAIDESRRMLKDNAACCLANC